MNYGISTGCFFPNTPLTALKEIAKLKVTHCEIFFNTESELKKPYLNKLKKIADENNINIVSIHPYTSAIETFLFFSKYEDKLKDAIKYYERYFKVCKFLGAKYVVFHGCFLRNIYMSDERYTEILNILAKKAREYDVFLSQENVFDYKCGYEKSLKYVFSNSNDDLKFTFDIKQAVRAKQDIYKIIDIMKDRLSHIHISDFTDNKDSLLPLEGNFDFIKFNKYIIENTTAQAMLIEVYEDRYDDVNMLKNSLSFLTSL